MTSIRESYINQSKSIHGDKFSYEKTKYKGANYKVTITCKLHGDFLQIARNHIRGHGCPECSGFCRDMW